MYSFFRFPTAALLLLAALLASWAIVQINNASSDGDSLSRTTNTAPGGQRVDVAPQRRQDSQGSHSNPSIELTAAVSSQANERPPRQSSAGSSSAIPGSSLPFSWSLSRVIRAVSLQLSLLSTINCIVLIVVLSTSTEYFNEYLPLVIIWVVTTFLWHLGTISTELIVDVFPKPEIPDATPPPTSPGLDLSPSEAELLSPEERSLASVAVALYDVPLPSESLASEQRLRRLRLTKVKQAPLSRYQIAAYTKLHWWIGHPTDNTGATANQQPQDSENATCSICLCPFEKAENADAVARRSPERAPRNPHYSRKYVSSVVLPYDINPPNANINGNAINATNPSLQAAGNQETPGQTQTIPVFTPISGDMVRTLPCLHTFHKACAEQWLLTRPGCPLCREHVVIAGRKTRRLALAADGAKDLDDLTELDRFRDVVDGNESFGNDDVRIEIGVGDDVPSVRADIGDRQGADSVDGNDDDGVADANANNGDVTDGDENANDRVVIDIGDIAVCHTLSDGQQYIDMEIQRQQRRTGLSTAPFPPENEKKNVDNFLRFRKTFASTGLLSLWRWRRRGFVEPLGDWVTAEGEGGEYWHIHQQSQLANRNSRRNPVDSNNSNMRGSLERRFQFATYGNAARGYNGATHSANNDTHPTNLDSNPAGTPSAIRRHNDRMALMARLQRRQFLENQLIDQDPEEVVQRRARRRATGDVMRECGLLQGQSEDRERQREKEREREMERERERDRERERERQRSTMMRGDVERNDQRLNNGAVVRREPDGPSIGVSSADTDGDDSGVLVEDTRTEAENAEPIRVPSARRIPRFASTDSDVQAFSTPTHAAHTATAAVSAALVALPVTPAGVAVRAVAGAVAGAGAAESVSVSGVTSAPGSLPTATPDALEEDGFPTQMHSNATSVVSAAGAYSLKDTFPVASTPATVTSLETVTSATSSSSPADHTPTPLAEQVDIATSKPQSSGKSAKKAKKSQKKTQNPVSASSTTTTSSSPANSIDRAAPRQNTTTANATGQSPLLTPSEMSFSTAQRSLPPNPARLRANARDVANAREVGGAVGMEMQSVWRNGAVETHAVRRASCNDSDGARRSDRDGAVPGDNTVRGADDTGAGTGRRQKKDHEEKERKSDEIYRRKERKDREKEKTPEKERKLERNGGKKKERRDTSGVDRERDRQREWRW